MRVLRETSLTPYVRRPPLLLQGPLPVGTVYTSQLASYYLGTQYLALGKGNTLGRRSGSQWSRSHSHPANGTNHRRALGGLNGD